MVGCVSLCVHEHLWVFPFSPQCRRGYQKLPLSFVCEAARQNTQTARRNRKDCCLSERERAEPKMSRVCVQFLKPWSQCHVFQSQSSRLSAWPRHAANQRRRVDRSGSANGKTLRKGSSSSGWRAEKQRVGSERGELFGATDSQWLSETPLRVQADFWVFGHLRKRGAWWVCQGHSYVLVPDCWLWLLKDETARNQPTVRDKHPAVNTLSFCTFLIPFFYSFFLIWRYASFPPPSSYFSSKMLCPRCVSAGFDIQQMLRCVCVCRRAPRRYLRCAPLCPQVNLMSFHSDGLGHIIAFLYPWVFGICLISLCLSLVLLFGSSASGQEHEITVQADIFHTRTHVLFTRLPYDLLYITEVDLSSWEEVGCNVTSWLATFTLQQNMVGPVCNAKCTLFAWVKECSDNFMSQRRVLTARLVNMCCLNGYAVWQKMCRIAIKFNSHTFSKGISLDQLCNKK